MVFCKAIYERTVEFQRERHLQMHMLWHRALQICNLDTTNNNLDSFARSIKFFCSQNSKRTTNSTHIVAGLVIFQSI
jgi:hypothetical protein